MYKKIPDIEDHLWNREIKQVADRYGHVSWHESRGQDKLHRHLIIRSIIAQK